MARKPLALSNWKMAMPVAEGLAFVREFQALAGELLAAVDVIICPPFTALWAVAQALRESRLQLGAQNVAPEHAIDLLAASSVDGLGATRRGRDPRTFLEIVRQIARVKCDM